MATATQIATSALKRLRIVGAGETPAAADIADATTALNQLINSWDAEGLDGDTLPLDDRHEAGIIAMLAVRLAGDYGKPVDAVLEKDATDGWRRLQAAYIQPETPTFDWALIRTPSRRFPYTVPIDGTNPWKANYTYTLGWLVTNNGNVYICTVAGTSGTTGPTGTDPTQTDGSVTWEYVSSIGGA